MNKKKTLILSIIGLIGLIIVTIGITYAIFTYTKLGTTDNTITSGTLKFLYTENTGVKTGIKLTNALPISDTQGKVLDGDNNVFDFSIEATNTGTEAIPYEVTLRKKSTSTLKEDYVKVYLTDRTETTEKEELEPTNFNKLIQTNIDVGNEIEKTIYSGNVNGGEVSYQKDFRLRMWIDDTEDSGDIYGKEFTAMVNVYSNAKVISETEQELRSNADIQSVIVGEDTLTKVVDQDYDYTITIPNTSNPIINVIPVNSLSNVEITKDNNTNIVNGTNINPIIGNNIYNVKVISADKSTTTSVKVRVKSQIPVSLKDEIMKNTIITASPTLTTSSNNSSDANGLYSSTATNTGEPTYYFRGNVENNYVKFAGQTWRIVRINEDGTIRMIMQDGIKNNTAYQFNSNANNYIYMYYTNSDIKTQLESWYQTNIGSETNLVNKVATGKYHCEQAKVKMNGWSSGNATMIVYTNYTPDFKCTTDGNGKGLVNADIGLLSYDEAVYAGGYYSQSNSNYYLYNSAINWWTMSPTGYYGGALEWIIYDNGSVATGYPVYYDFSIRPVICLNSNILAIGSGTSLDPFIINY